MSVVPVSAAGSSVGIVLEPLLAVLDHPARPQRKMLVRKPAHLAAAVTLVTIILGICGASNANAQTENYKLSAVEALERAYDHATADCWATYKANNKIFDNSDLQACLNDAKEILYPLDLGPPPVQGALSRVIRGWTGALFRRMDQNLPQPNGSLSSTITPSLRGDVPALPLLGNWLVGLDFLPNSLTPADVTAVYGVGLRRQSDCSLDEDYVVPFASTPSAGDLTSLTGAQD